MSNLEISCADVRKLQHNDMQMLLIDCREAEEHAIGTIADARLLPMSQIESRLAELAGHEQAQIVVYCHHGVRSTQVAHWLRHQGFARAQSMAGGIDLWSLEIDSTIPRY